MKEATNKELRCVEFSRVKHKTFEISYIQKREEKTRTVFSIDIRIVWNNRVQTIRIAIAPNGPSCWTRVSTTNSERNEKDDECLFTIERWSTHSHMPLQCLGMIATAVLLMTWSVGLLEVFASVEFSQIIELSLSSISVMADEILSVSTDFIFLALLVDSTWNRKTIVDRFWRVPVRSMCSTRHYSLREWGKKH